jgi:hypothetical protein
MMLIIQFLLLFKLIKRVIGFLFTSLQGRVSEPPGGATAHILKKASRGWVIEYLPTSLHVINFIRNLLMFHSS